jgi:hypothetical protein
MIVDIFMPHMRHENIHDHQIERVRLKRTQTAFSSICNRNLETVPFKIDFYGHADHWIIVDNQYPRHAIVPPLHKGSFCPST